MSLVVKLRLTHKHSIISKVVFPTIVYVVTIRNKIPLQRFTQVLNFSIITSYNFQPASFIMESSTSISTYLTIYNQSVQNEEELLSQNF